MAILKEASENGATETLEKYGIFPATYYSWKKKLSTMGEEGFVHGMTPPQLKKNQRVRKRESALERNYRRKRAGRQAQR